MDQRLIIENLSKTYPKTGVKANKQISCEFESGLVHALLGHNGAGKTTLLNQIIGLLKPDQGKIIFEELDLIENPQTARELIAMMPQLHSPIRGMTTRQAIRSIGKIRGMSGTDLEQAVDALLTTLDIEEWQHRKVEKLSGGLLRLVSFAMAVIAPPPVLLLDEPTNDVDPVRRKLLWQYLQRLASAGHIVVIVTHNLLEVQGYADRYYFFHKGSLLRSGNVIDLKAERQLRVEGRAVENTEFPLSVKKREDGLFTMQVPEEKVASFLQWLGKEVENEHITEYEMNWLDLNEIYGGWIDATETT